MLGACGHNYCPEAVTNVSVCVPEFPSASLRGGGPRAQKLGFPRQNPQSVCVPECPRDRFRGGEPRTQKLGFPRPTTQTYLSKAPFFKTAVAGQGIVFYAAPAARRSVFKICTFSVHSVSLQVVFFFFFFLHGVLCVNEK